MTQRLGPAVDVLFLLAALAWPLDLLQYVPGLGVSLLATLALALIPALLIDATAQQKLRVPFEILAPAVVILGLTGVDAARRGPSESFVEIVTAFVWLVAAAHFAPSHDAIRRYLFASVVSGFAVTLWTLFSRLLDFTPTAFSERSGVTFSFAYTIPSAIHILLVLGCASLYVARERRYPPPARAAATAAIAFIACALVGTAVFWAVDTRSLPVSEYQPLDALQIAALVLVLWLASRIIGKVVIALSAAHDPMHTLWFNIAIASLLVVASAPLAPGGYHGFLAGLACASVLPARLVADHTRHAAVLAVIPAALAVLNLTTVFPGNLRDQRQYDAASRRDFESAAYPRLLARLDTIERHAPAERRTHLWRARTALALGLPNWASYEFIEALKPENGRLLLAAPSDAERKDFLVQMRDIVATMAEERSVCAFERSLLAEGDRDAALYSLRLETAVPLTHVEATDPVPFAAAVAFIAGDKSITEELRFWSPDELITLLTYWGATLEDTSQAPTETFLVVAQRVPHALHLLVYQNGRAETLQVTLAPPAPEDVSSLTSAGTLHWTREVGGQQSGYYALKLSSASIDSEVGRLSVAVNGAVKFEWTDPVVGIPFTPAIYLRAGP